MTSPSLLLVSADGHVGPPTENYRRYLDLGLEDDFDAFVATHQYRWTAERDESFFRCAEGIASVRVAGCQRWSREPFRSGPPAQGAQRRRCGRRSVVSRRPKPQHSTLAGRHRTAGPRPRLSALIASCRCPCVQPLACRVLRSGIRAPHWHDRTGLVGRRGRSGQGGTAGARSGLARGDPLAARLLPTVVSPCARRAFVVDL